MHNNNIMIQLRNRIPKIKNIIMISQKNKTANHGFMRYNSLAKMQLNILCAAKNFK